MNALLFLMEPWVQPLGNMDWMKVAQEGKGSSQSKKKYLTMVIFFHSLKVKSLEIFIVNFMKRVLILRPLTHFQQRLWRKVNFL